MAKNIMFCPYCGSDNISWMGIHPISRLVEIQESIRESKRDY